MSKCSVDWEGLATASRLDAEEASDYYVLKTALLKVYDFTGEGFRKKFRTARIEKGETYPMYGTKKDKRLPQ